MVRIVTVPLDLNAEADRAIGPAAVLARQLGAVLELVVVSSPGLGGFGDEAELQARAAQLAGVSVSTCVRTAPDALGGLLELADDPERLICMASHGRSRFGELLTPSVALSLVHTAQRPAVIVGPHLDWWPGPVGTLLVGLDERGVPPTTLALVADWSGVLGAGVELIRAQTPDQRPDDLDDGALAVEEARQWLEGRGVTVGIRHLLGEPAVTLADAADRAGGRSPLVVVTGRVGTRRERVLHGSVTSRLISANRVPTLVVPSVVALHHPSPLTPVER